MKKKKHSGGNPTQPNDSPTQASTAQQTAEAPQKHGVGRRYYRKSKELLEKYIVARLSSGVHWLDRHDGAVTAAATVAIAMLTLLIADYAKEQGVTADGQLKAMQGQLDEMKETTAVMKIQSLPKIANGLDPPWVVTDKDGKTTGWNITPNVTNSGQTDAINFSVWDNAHYFPANEADGIDFPNTPNGPTQPIVLPAGGKIAQVTAFMAVGDVQNVLDGKGKIILWGNIQWDDSFAGDPTHIKYYCFQIIPTRDPQSGNIILTLPLLYQSPKDNCNGEKDQPRKN